MNSTNTETRSLNLRGVYTDETETTVTNTGVITNSGFTIVTIDSTYRDINAADAEWYSSNNAVVQVVKGILTARTPGFAFVWAQIQNVVSDSVLVNARVADTAPGLILDPPDVIVIFQNSIVVSGTVQAYSVLRIQEPTSGYLNPNVSYNDTTGFHETVTGLSPGIRIIHVTAQHPTRADLFTTKDKCVYYYTYGSQEADSIVGPWHGECFGRPLNFIVSKDPILPRYGISGTLDIQFLGYGVIQDVDIRGPINSNGDINLNVSKSTQGYSISGSLTGHFRNTGQAQGIITAQMKKSGWPDLGFRESWWAEKE
jgi:hypothetical protein